jgi:hypothetical protein
MAYIINRFSGLKLVVLDDGTLDTSTSIGLLGRNYTGYGEVQNENFLYLLENFANDAPPARPLSGQTWYDTITNSLNVYNGSSWTPVGSAIVSQTEPSGFNGSLWYKNTTDQLSVYEDGVWKLIGPEAVDGFGITKLRARSVLDSENVNHAILELLVDGSTLAVCSNTTFILNDLNTINGFNELKPGLNVSSLKNFVGSLDGNAASASRLSSDKSINGVVFDGHTDITITAGTTGTLTRGTYLTGSNFNGLSPVTWAVDATSSNVIGKVVARDSAGNFEAGTITANLDGNVSGNVTSTGTSSFNVIHANQFIGATLSGNADTATRFATPRTINGVAFDGSINVTVPVSASNVTGTTLSSSVVNSSLETLGTLNNLDVSTTGFITMGGPNPVTASLAVTIEGVTPTFTGNTGSIDIGIVDTTLVDDLASFSFVNSTVSLTAGGPAEPALLPDTAGTTNLGISTRKWNTVYANLFNGTASSARYADLAENYVADVAYEAGTVLEFGGQFEVTLAEDGTNRVAGVVTTNPAYLMNSECAGEFVVGIALQGRVPCKVRGKICKGDMLISAGDGFARPAHSPTVGTVIGKALEAFDGISGVIEVAVGRI